MRDEIKVELKGNGRDKEQEDGVGERREERQNNSPIYGLEQMKKKSWIGKTFAN